jgi:anti-sigma factor RsiW
MPNCRAIQNRLGRYFDGELSLVERRLVANHLQQCGRCSQSLHAIREIAGVFPKTMQSAPVPSDLTLRIMEKARMQVGGALQGRRFFGFWENWSFSMRFAAVGVAAAACYIGIVIGSTSMPYAGRAGDEMQWVGMASPGSIANAYIGSAQ